VLKSKTTQYLSHKARNKIDCQLIKIATWQKESLEKEKPAPWREQAFFETELRD
jgi:hypothetical protein